MGVVGLVSLLLGVGVSRSIEGLSENRSTGVIPESSRALPDFVALGKKLRPAVVNIAATLIKKGGGKNRSAFGADNPAGDLRDQLFGTPPPQAPDSQKSLGSGFVIDRDGFILTNNHVIENAQKISVKLSDEREFQGRVVGRDSVTDIAVIKIDAGRDLPVASLGDSDRLEVGEWVMAIGNPFGLDSTVTVGIVSGKGRHLGTGSYDSFIQTDASINPGNSGGPLVNVKGEVVGINAAIVSEGGGSIGIGFATPINLVRGVLPQLKTKGKASRGWLGVAVQRVTPEMAGSLGLSKPTGALVASVARDGPAGRAGIKAGDVIVNFDGNEIKRSDDLPLIVARSPVHKAVQVKLLRDKKEVAVPVIVGELREANG